MARRMPRNSGGGALDFAGGTVVHISSGVSALVCALLLGKRLGYGHEPMPPHNLTYTALGAGMLWVGVGPWFTPARPFGRAAGCQRLYRHAFCRGRRRPDLVDLRMVVRGKPSVLGVCSGVAGLACITQASGYVTPMPALLIGAVGGGVCYTVCTSSRSAWLRRFAGRFRRPRRGRHAGRNLTGIFATRATGASARVTADFFLLGLMGGGTLFEGRAGGRCGPCLGVGPGRHLCDP